MSRGARDWRGRIKCLGVTRLCQAGSTRSALLDCAAAACTCQECKGHDEYRRLHLTHDTRTDRRSIQRAGTANRAATERATTFPSPDDQSLHTVPAPTTKASKPFQPRRPRAANRSSLRWAQRAAWRGSRRDFAPGARRHAARGVGDRRSLTVTVLRPLHSSHDNPATTTLLSRQPCDHYTPVTTTLRPLHFTTALRPLHSSHDNPATTTFQSRQPCDHYIPVTTTLPLRSSHRRTLPADEVARPRSRPSPGSRRPLSKPGSSCSQGISLISHATSWVTEDAVIAFVEDEERRLRGTGLGRW